MWNETILQPTSSYIAPMAVRVFNSLPRYGHNDDLASVITGEEGWQDYSLGIIMIGCLILVLFVLWTILEFLFLFCGPCVGILSGKRLPQERGGCYRFLAMSNCILSFIVAVIFLVKVTNSLEETFDNVRESTNDLSNLARNVTSIVNQVIKAGNETVPIRDASVEMLSDGLCSSFPAGNGETIDFDAKGLEVTDVLTALSDFTNGDLTDLRDTFEEQFVAAEIEIANILNKSQDYAKISYYAIAIVIVTFLLSLQGHMAWFGPRIASFFCFQKWFTIPLYFLLLLFSAIVSAALSQVLVVNSDICLGGQEGNPESFIGEILHSLNLDNYTMNVLDFYILDECEGNFEGLDLVNKLVNDLIEGRDAVNDLDFLLEISQSDFEILCGGEEGSLDAFRSSLSSVDVAFNSFVIAAEGARDLLQCEPMNEIYKDFMHKDVCDSLPITITWMFSTMLSVVVLGMTVFSLRGALLPPLPPDMKELESRSRGYYDDRYDDYDDYGDYDDYATVEDRPVSRDSTPRRSVSRESHPGSVDGRSMPPPSRLRSRM